MMLYNWKDIEKEYGSAYRVREAVENGKVYKLGRGLYSDMPTAHPFAIAAQRYPSAIITMDTAFYLHGLTDVVPKTTCLATLRNATRIKDPDVTQFFLSEAIFLPGKTQMDVEGATVSVYDKERMLIEAMRNSKSLPFDYYKEVITGYRRLHESLDYQRIEEYLSLFKRNGYMWDILQREVLCPANTSRNLSWKS